MFRFYNAKILKSFKTQFTVAFLLVSIISVMICAGILYMVIKNETKEKLIKQHVDYSKQMAFVLEYFIQDLSRYVTHISTSKQVMEMTRYNKIEDYPSVQAFLDFLQLTDNYSTGLAVDSVFFYLDNDIILGRNSRANIFLNTQKNQRLAEGCMTTQSPQFARLNDSTTLSFAGVFDSQVYNYFNSVEGSYPCLSFSRSVSWPVYKHNCLLVLNIKESTFRRLYSEKDPQSSIEYVVNSDGIIVSHRDQAQIGEMDDIFFYLRDNKVNITTYRLMDKQYRIIRSPVGKTGLFLMTLLPENALLNGGIHYQELMVITLSVIILLPLPVLWYLVNRLSRPLNELTESMQKIGQGELWQEVKYGPYYELNTLAEQFNKMSVSLSNLETRVKHSEAEKRKSELQALQAYINPHFLYNTVNVFKWMAVTINARKLTDALNAFASTLKPLYAVKSEMWSCREERDFILSYIKVMNYRYGGGVKVSMQIPDELLTCSILKFTIQPLIENAFMYGIDPIDSTGTILVDFMSSPDELVITVRDYGQGMPEDKLLQIQQAIRSSDMAYGERGIGLENINKRIKLHYGEKAGLEIDSGVSGTIVKTHLPK